MIKIIRSLFGVFSFLVIATAHSGSYYSSSVSSEGNAFTAMSDMTLICENFPPAEFCPAGIQDIIVTGYDSSGCAMYSCASYQSEIKITEFMPSPKAVNDANGEWFEIYNSTDADINLNGWRYRDNGIGNFNIAKDLIVQSKGYKVLVKDDDLATNGGIAGGYKLASSFNLGNKRDEIIIEKPNGSGGFVEVDRVEYDIANAWIIVEGKSTKLNNIFLDNNVVSNWSLATTNYGLGDFGTPGGVND